MSAETLIFCEAIVDEFLYNHHDDVDGWRLSDGHLVHFPPHVGAALSEWIGIGDEVYVEGYSKKHHDNREMLHANYVESQGWMLDWRHDEKKHQNHPPHQPDGDVLFRILTELITIRQLLESGKALS